MMISDSHDYDRELPRDLFNEAKLLKCLGQLSLVIHDGIDSRKQPTPPGLQLIHNRHFADDGLPVRGFVIRQDQATGDIFAANVRCVAGSTLTNARELLLYTPVNSRAPYPLVAEIDDDDSDALDVFNDDGSLSADFLWALGGAIVPTTEPTQ